MERSYYYSIVNTVHALFLSIWPCVGLWTWLADDVSTTVQGLCQSWVTESDVQFQQVGMHAFAQSKLLVRHVSPMLLSYNNIISINGIPACANKKLLTDILKTEWGFTGNRLNIVIALPFKMYIYNIIIIFIHIKGYVVSDRGALGKCMLRICSINYALFLLCREYYDWTSLHENGNWNSYCSCECWCLFGRCSYRKQYS